MIRHPRRFGVREGVSLLTAVVVVAAAGCGDGKRIRSPDAGPGDAAIDAPGDALPAFDDLLERIAKAACGWHFRCCTLPEIESLGGSSFLTETECVQRWTPRLRLLLAVEWGAVLEGRLAVDAQRVNACVERLSARVCNNAGLTEDVPVVDLPGLLSVCQDPFVGHTPAGGSCTNLRECEPTSGCFNFSGGSGGRYIDNAGVSQQVPLGEFVNAQGVCVADRKEGDRCDAFQQCGLGLYCRRTDFVCARPAREGEPCISIPPNESQPQGPPIVCGDGAHPLMCVDSVCRRLPHDGEPCLEGAPPCDPAPGLDLACVGRQLGGSGICKTAGRLGAVCGADGIPPCAAPLACPRPDGGNLGTCQEPPREGQPCFGGGCRAPAVCYGATQTCVVPKGGRFGTRCQSDLDCASLTCAFDPATSAASGFCVQAVELIICAGAGATGVDGRTPPPDP